MGIIYSCAMKKFLVLDVELIQAVCFESKSLKDLVVIYSFLLITLLMLFYIVFKTLFLDKIKETVLA